MSARSRQPASLAALVAALVTALVVGTPAPAQVALPGSSVAGDGVAAATTPPVPRAELRGHVDWQGHPAMHMAYPSFFSEGMRDDAPTALTWEHRFEQQVYTPFLRRSGVRVMGAAAMAAERAESPGQAHRVIVDQLERVERYVATHPNDFVLARTPAEVRRALATPGRMVIVHQIEGGRRILLDPRDAWYWRSRGVMLVTVMHLLHDELGHAAMNIGPVSGVLNVFFNGANLQPSLRRGLTPRGRAAIVELARAGIVVDLSHMAPAAVDDALAVCRQRGIAPVVTHGMYRAIQDSERGLTADQIVEIYRLGGMLSIPVDGNSLDPINPTVRVPAGLAPGTMDMFRFHLETVHALLRANARAILGRPWAQLSDPERTRLAVGWASDWNGWTEHSRPTPRSAVRGRALEVDRVGLAHPGLLPEYWQRLREGGMDFDPLERSLERFVQIWEETRRRARSIRL